jgi:hypothetical protein
MEIDLDLLMELTLEEPLPVLLSTNTGDHMTPMMDLSTVSATLKLDTPMTLTLMMDLASIAEKLTLNVLDVTMIILKAGNAISVTLSPT